MDYHYVRNDFFQLHCSGCYEKEVFNEQKNGKFISENYLVASGDFNNAIKQGINLNIIVNGKRK